MRDILIVGDTLDYTTSVPDYLASDGYALTYRLIPRTSGSAITITTIASGDDFRAYVAPAVTATWTAGEYSWAAYVTKAGDRWTVDEGTCTIKVDPATVAAYDGRSEAQIALEAAIAALANYTATGGRVRRYAIAGREMEYANAADLLKEVNYWQSVVNREQAAEAVRKGQADPRRVYIRMSNA